MRSNNRTILDISKIAYVIFFYRSGEYERFLKPRKHTVHGCEIDEEEFALPYHDYPHETLIERARRLDIIDKWIPVLKISMNNGHILEFTGKKAISLKEAFSSKQFSGK